MAERVLRVLSRAQGHRGQGPAGRHAVPSSRPAAAWPSTPAITRSACRSTSAREGMTHVDKAGAFNRLMVAQDVGSAIKGPERGDIYFGSGDAAGQLAGVTKHAGKFIVLLPKDTPARAEVAPGKSAPDESPAMSGAGRKSGGGRPHRHRRRGRALGARDAQPRAGQSQAARRLPSMPPPPILHAGSPHPRRGRRRRREAPAPPAKPTCPQLPKPRAARRRRSPTSIAARSARSPPARSRSRRASTCTGCASATLTRACAPSCSRPTPGATRPCWSSPARAARSRADRLGDLLGRAPAWRAPAQRPALAGRA